jgi:hypothetical protein
LIFSVCSCFAACRRFSHYVALACLRRAFAAGLFTVSLRV